MLFGSVDFFSVSRVAFRKNFGRDKYVYWDKKRPEFVLTFFNTAIVTCSGL